MASNPPISKNLYVPRKGRDVAARRAVRRTADRRHGHSTAATDAVGTADWARLALILIAVAYHVWRPKDLAPILGATLKESTMLMFIIGMSLLFSYVMSYLHISQSAAHAIVAMHLSKWLLLAAILSMVVVLGFFLPPVSIILMTAPIILPPLRAAGFDLIWFGVLMTIVMEMGLIHPPVGLNIFVIKNIAPDIPLRDVVWGAAVCRADVRRDRADMPFSRHRDGIPDVGDGSRQITASFFRSTSSRRRATAAARDPLPARSSQSHPTPQNDERGDPAPGLPRSAS
jgi:hypothetical protein